MCIFYFNYKINLTFSQDSYVKDVLQISSSIYGSEFRFFRVEAEYHFQQGSKNDNQKKILKFFKGKLLKSLEIFEKSKKFAKTNLERLITCYFFNFLKFLVSRPQPRLRTFAHNFLMHGTGK
jgi:hypothetical protein